MGDLQVQYQIGFTFYILIQTCVMIPAAAGIIWFLCVRGKK